MPEKIPPKSAEAEIRDVRRELANKCSEEIMQWLDDLRTGKVEPAEGPAEEMVDLAYIAEARRRADLLVESADEVKKILTERRQPKREAA